MNPRTLSNLVKWAFTGLTTLISLSTANPSYADSTRDLVVARMGCSNNGPIVLYPEYYGQTRSGFNIWICVETGSRKQSFIIFNKGPYPVIACDFLNCRVIDYTY